MKTALVITLLALCGTVYGDNDKDFVYKFAKCAVRAAAAGIEGLIPRHDPLHIRDLSYNATISGVQYRLQITNFILYGFSNLEFKQVDVTSYTNPGAVNIDYDIYWKVLNLTGDFAWSSNVSKPESGGKGKFKATLHHSDFTGLFKLIKPGQKGIKEHLDDFTWKISVKEVGAHVEGVTPKFLTNQFVESTLYKSLNNIPASLVTYMKEKRFNEFWIAHPERIEQIIKWCHDFPEA